MSYVPRCSSLSKSWTRMLGHWGRWLGVIKIFVLVDFDGCMYKITVIAKKGRLNVHIHGENACENQNFLRCSSWLTPLQYAFGRIHFSILTCVFLNLENALAKQYCTTRLQQKHAKSALALLHFASRFFYHHNIIKTDTYQILLIDWLIDESF